MKDKEEYGEEEEEEEEKEVLVADQEEDLNKKMREELGFLLPSWVVSFLRNSSRDSKRSTFTLCPSRSTKSLTGSSAAN